MTDQSDSIPIVLTEGKFKGVIFSVDNIVDSPEGLQLSYSIHHKPKELDFVVEEFEKAINDYVVECLRQIIEQKEGALLDGEDRNDGTIEPDSQ